MHELADIKLPVLIYNVQKICLLQLHLRHVLSNCVRFAAYQPLVFVSKYVPILEQTTVLWPFDNLGELGLSQRRDLLEQPLDFYEPDVLLAARPIVSNTTRKTSGLVDFCFTDMARCLTNIQVHAAQYIVLLLLLVTVTHFSTVC